MKKFLAILLAFAILVCGAFAAFLGWAVFTERSLRSDLEQLESYEFELLYHIAGESDLLDIAQYDTDSVPVVTKWFTSYLSKVQQSGRIDGKMHDGVYHADVYIGADDEASIEFYYDGQAVFGIKKTIDYIISSLAEDTKLPISILQSVIPEGYISTAQIKTLLGAAKEEQTTRDFVEIARVLIKNLRFRVPTMMEETNFQSELEGLGLSYFSGTTSLNGVDEINIEVGVKNGPYDKYIQLMIADDTDSEGVKLELLLHIKVTDTDEIVVPETIMNEIIEPLASVISLINKAQNDT